MEQIEAILPTEAWDTTTAEQVKDNKEFVESLNYLLEEGLIEVEEDDNGELRLYPR